MAIEYPCNLPTPKVAPYSYREILHTRQNDVQSGPPRFELLNEKTPAFFSAVWSMSGSEFQAFEAWWKFKALWGAQSFFIDLDVGAGLVQHECNLPSFDRAKSGRRWAVTGTLVAVEVVYEADECVADDLLQISEELLPTLPGGPGAQLRYFNNFAETTLPDFLESISYGTDYS